MSSRLHLFLFLISSLVVSSSFAQTPGFDRLAEKVVREPNPFSFIKFNSNVDLGLDDFYFQGADGKPTDDLRWMPDSFQWARVGNGKDEAGILIPRARAVTTKGTQVEVALMQYENEIKVDGKTYRLRFRPMKDLKSRYYFDSSCSSFKPEITNEKLWNSWVMITCHRVNNTGDNGTKPVVAVAVLWENEQGGTLQQINFSSEVPKVSLKNGNDSLDLDLKVAPVFHHLGLSAGVGPYSSRNVVKPFVTVYGSYFFNDALKVASFAALPIRANPEVDWGGYLVMEQFRGVDERISLNFLIGAHMLSYVAADGKRTNSFSGPQGIELTFRDLFFKNMHFMTGGFFYPKINDRSYMNAWVRYGTNQYFLELNFIEWQEPDPYFYSKSFGVSVGFPLFRML